MFSKFKPLLYFVTPEIDEDIEKWANLVINAVAGGVNVVQVRDKKSSAKKIISAVRRIHPFLKRAKVPLLINDRADIAFAAQVEGIHLGQSDLNVRDARLILGRDAIIGLSIETIDQVKDAEEEEINYLAASPVFTSSTKLDCCPPWGLDALKQLCSVSFLPIVAIGGINFSNIQEVLRCGVAGIAVVSAIASLSSPQKAARELIDKMNI